MNKLVLSKIIQFTLIVSALVVIFGLVELTNEENVSKNSGVQILQNKDNIYEMRLATTTDDGVRLYIQEDEKAQIKLLYNAGVENPYSDQETVYDLSRVYPYMSDEHILRDYNFRSAGKILFPTGFRYGDFFAIFENFRVLPESANLNVRKVLYASREGFTNLPKWFSVPKDCFGYLSGDNCTFEIMRNNPEKLTANKLNQKTGPFNWSNALTPQSIYLTTDSKIVISWVFGDAGAYSRVFSLWDTDTNTHTQLFDITSFEQDEIALTLPSKEYVFVYWQNPERETTAILKREPFEGVEIAGHKLKNSCYSVNFFPTDVRDGGAPWYVEYVYGCLDETLHGLSVVYKLDVVNEELKEITEIFPR